MHVLILEIEFEFSACVVSIDHCGKDLRLLDKVLVDQLDLELSLQFLVQNFHWLQGATREYNA